MVQRAADAVLGTEQRFECDAWRGVQKVDGGISVAICAAMVCDQTYLESLQRAKAFLGQLVNAVEHAHSRLVPGSARRRTLGNFSRRKSTQHTREVKANDRFARQSAEPPFQRQDVSLPVRVHPIRQEDPKRVRERINPKTSPGKPGVTIRADGKDLAPWAAVTRVDVPTQPTTRIGQFGGRLDSRHHAHRLRLEQPQAVELSIVEHHPGKVRQIRRRRE